MNTFLVLSEYTKDSFIRNLFKKRGNWQMKEKGKVDFLFIQGDRLSRERRFWNQRAFIKNRIDLDTIIISQKNQVYKKVDKQLRDKYLLAQKSINLGPSFRCSNYKSFIEKYPITILKPIYGYAGKHISTVEDYEDFKKIIKPILEEKKADNWSNRKMKKDDYINRLNWVLEEYVLDPYLYKKKKFHFRPYFIYYHSKEENKAFLYNKFRIAVADQNYVSGDFKNKDIHDTHFTANEKTEAIYLDDFLSRKNYNIIVEQLIELFTNISKNLSVKCYPENDICLQIFAADVMITKNIQIKLIEINTNPGFISDRFLKLNTAGHILENIMYHIIDPIFPPKNKINDPEGFIKLI